MYYKVRLSKFLFLPPVLFVQSTFSIFFGNGSIDSSQMNDLLCQSERFSSLVMSICVMSFSWYVWHRTLNPWLRRTEDQKKKCRVMYEIWLGCGWHNENVSTSAKWWKHSARNAIKCWKMISTGCHRGRQREPDVITKWIWNGKNIKYTKSLPFENRFFFRWTIDCCWSWCSESQRTRKLKTHWMNNSCVANGGAHQK